MDSLQEYGQNREKKMKKSEIEMENIYETVDDFAVYETVQDLQPKPQVNFKFFKGF